MRTFLELVRIEALLQGRSLRARGAVLVFLVAAIAPAVLAARAQNGELLLGSSTYVADVLTFLPQLAAVLAAVLSLDAIVRDRRSGAWSVLSLTPMSNAGYVLRRWGALVTLLLPLSALPLAAALVLARVHDAPSGPLVNAVLPWLCRVVPVVAGVSAAALGAGTLADGLVPGILLLATLAVVAPALLQRALAPARRHASVELSPWLDPENAERRILFYRIALRPDRFRDLRAVVPATESPLPARVFATATLATGLLPLAGCALLLGASSATLRRATPDLPPWRPRPGHPLRTLLGLASRLRPRFARDPHPAVADRALRLGVALFACGALGLWWARDAHYRRDMEATHALQISGWPAPTPATVVPVEARLDASLDARGRAAATSELTLRNDGGAPVRHLALTLLPSVELASLTADRGSVASERRGERLAVELDPPLAPAESRRLRATTRGTPARVDLALRSPGAPFELRYRVQAHSLAADLKDLALSLTRPAALPERIDLGWGDLAPQPRFAPWTLQRASGFAGGGLDLLPTESAAPPTRLTVAIAAPRGVLLADACGGAGDARIQSACTMPLRDWALAGGRLVTVPGLPVTFGVLPPHRAHATRLAEGLAGLPELTRRAWATSGALPPPVLLEESPDWAGDPRRGIASFSGYEEQVGMFALRTAGSLVRVPEALLVRDRPLDAANVVAATLAQTLLRRRLLDPVDQPVIEGLVREVVLARLGRTTPGGATIACRRLDLPSFRVSLLDAEDREYSGWRRRLVAVTRELLARVGAEAVERGIERFLARGDAAGGAADDPRGGLRELLAAVAAESGADLSVLVRDGFERGALPELGLADVRLTGGDGAFTVSGRVVNEGTGEARCPVSVTTPAGSVDTSVVVPEKGAATFTIATRVAPQAVLLDPDAACLRWQPDPPGILVQRVNLEVLR